MCFLVESFVILGRIECGYLFGDVVMIFEEEKVN